MSCVLRGCSVRADDKGRRGRPQQAHDQAPRQSPRGAARCGARTPGRGRQVTGPTSTGEAGGGASVELGGEAWARGSGAFARSSAVRSTSSLGAPSHASLSLVTTRCSLVPAFDSLTPRTRGDLGVGEAGEELERDQLALARRRASPGPRATTRRRSLRSAGSTAVRLSVGRLGCQLGLAAPAPQLVERRVAGDPEQPGSRACPGGGRSASACGRRARRRSR